MALDSSERPHFKKDCHMIYAFTHNMYFSRLVKYFDYLSGLLLCFPLLVFFYRDEINLSSCFKGCRSADMNFILGSFWFYILCFYMPEVAYFIVD